MVATVATALVATLLTACVPTPTPDPYGLVAVLTDEGIELGWDGVGTPHDVQVRTGTGPWSALGTTSEGSITHTEVENRTRYGFRVRSSAGGGSPAGAWSPQLTSLYVDLVLPVVRIDTDGAAPILDRDNYVRGRVRIEPNGSGYEGLDATVGIRGRGNSTWGYPKKPYRMKLDAATEVLGIAAERDWVLLANHLDESQLRNHAAAKLSATTDLAHSPTTRHVEVVLNGHYEGVYTLTEHTEVGPDRVDVTEMGPGDTAGEALTGGYLMEIDARLEANDEPGFRTTAGVPVVVKDPDPMATEQEQYIRSRVQAFEDALMGPDFADPALGYRAHLDLRSFIDHYLVQEVTRNEDAFWSSTYFTKERGEDRFAFGPVWDFDRSIGSNDETEVSPYNWWVRERGEWTPRLFEDPAFVDELVQRWDELRPAFLVVANGLVGEGDALRPAVLNDAVRWERDMDLIDEPSFLRNWLVLRISWMNSRYHSGG